MTYLSPYPPPPSPVLADPLSVEKQTEERRRSVRQWLGLAATVGLLGMHAFDDVRIYLGWLTLAPFTLVSLLGAGLQRQVNADKQRGETYHKLDKYEYAREELASHLADEPAEPGFFGSLFGVGRKFREHATWESKQTTRRRTVAETMAVARSSLAQLAIQHRQWIIGLSIGLGIEVLFYFAALVWPGFFR